MPWLRVCLRAGGSCAHLRALRRALHRRKTNAIARGWAFLVAALVFYVPANLLPVMHTEMLGSGSDSTIGAAWWSSGNTVPGTSP